MGFKQVHAKITVDLVEFTFGVVEGEEDTMGYRVAWFGAGDYSAHQVYNPLLGDKLDQLIEQLSGLSPQNPKLVIKFILDDDFQIKIQFRGYKENKGYKVSSKLSAFLFSRNSSLFNAKIPPDTIERLIANLAKCC